MESILKDTDELEKRFKVVAHARNTVTLWDLDHVVTDQVIFSKGFYDCNGVALLNHSFVGLSHYDTPDKHHGRKPEDYLSELVNDFMDISNSSDISAVLIGGDKDHFEKNEDILQKRKIPIIGRFLEKPDKRGYKAKDIVVIPNTREVLMYTKGEYSKLA